MAKALIFLLLTFPLLNVRAQKADEVPGVFFSYYGQLSRAVWATYNSKGSFDLELFADDCIKHSWGNIYTGLELAEISLAVGMDPKQIIENCLKSEEKKHLVFGMDMVLQLGDRRFLDAIRKLQTSNEPIGHEEKGKIHGHLDPFGSSGENKIKTVGDFAKHIVTTLESDETDSFVAMPNPPLKWLVEARKAGK